MLNKLAFRNVLRSARDYMVYFLTMMLVTAIMFAFHSLIFSEEIKQLSESSLILHVFIGMASFFVVLIMAWLINYMVRFILDKRSREFGIYLLIGMKKKEISRLYLRERSGPGTAAAANSAGRALQHDPNGISGTSGMEPELSPDHRSLLWRLLPAGPAAMQTQVPENEYPRPD